MVTGASTADLALILVDARKGLLEQSRRHAFIASLLGIPHIVLCVNKMDLVDWSRERFDEIREEFRQFAMKLDVPDLTFVPMSALHGDNIVHRSTSMPWYEGTSLLHHLEEVHISSDRNLIDARLPVQYVIRGNDHRSYAGTVAGGIFKPGDEVLVLPGGFTSTIKAVWGPGGDRVAEAFPPQAVTVQLTDELDIGRGDLICRPGNRPHAGQDIDAMVCWLTERSELTPDARYTILHTTRSTRAQVQRLDYRLDINSLHREAGVTGLRLNEIGRVQLRTQQPLLFDAYRRNRTSGSFVLVDEATNNTVAAGMITGPSMPVVWHSTAVRRDERGTRGLTIWLTGLSASGKSTVAVELERRLVAAGRPAYLLDGDNLRHGLNADLGFSAADRAENVRRVGEVARLFADAGVVAVVSLISPYRADRERVRAAHDELGLSFYEVFVDTPIETCEERDPKGMYAKARAGEIRGFTGVDDPYEAPRNAELVLRPQDGDPATMANTVMALLADGQTNTR
jgi:bifunctional enzyme CysN/CysC